MQASSALSGLDFSRPAVAQSRDPTTSGPAIQKDRSNHKDSSVQSCTLAASGDLNPQVLKRLAKATGVETFLLGALPTRDAQ